MNSRLVTLWLPERLDPLIDQAVFTLDTDRSKFIRCAIREKLLRAGIRVPNTFSE